MSHPLKPNAVERIAGNVVTEAALTAAAAAIGGVLAPLLPVLTKSLAARRQEERVQATLIGLNQLLQDQDDRVRALSDGQYKLVNECILAIFHTTEVEKLMYLRRIVENSLGDVDLGASEATILARVIRDISSAEVDFLTRTFQYQGGIRLTESTEPELDGPDGLRIPKTSKDASSVSGCMSLGLLVPSESGWGGTGSMTFTPMCAKLLVLLRASGA